MAQPKEEETSSLSSFLDRLMLTPAEMADLLQSWAQSARDRPGNLHGKLIEHVTTVTTPQEEAEVQTTEPTDTTFYDAKSDPAANPAPTMEVSRPAEEQPHPNA